MALVSDIRAAIYTALKADTTNLRALCRTISGDNAWALSESAYPPTLSYEIEDNDGAIVMDGITSPIHFVLAVPSVTEAGVGLNNCFKHAIDFSLMIFLTGKAVADTYDNLTKLADYTMYSINSISSSSIKNILATNAAFRPIADNPDMTVALISIRVDRNLVI